MSSAEASLVQASHLSRRAYLYVRQSTLRQVHDNTESARRQYALRARAEALRREGGNPFREHQLPEAALNLEPRHPTPDARNRKDF